MTIVDMNPVVAEVIRSGLAESRHRGTVAGLAADGGGDAVVGEVRAVGWRG